MARMSSMTLLLTGVVAILLCFLEIHAGIIPERESESFSANIQSQQPAPQKLVSWQTAFWTLLPLALNAMTQNSIFDSDFPFGVLFPARSSPLICAFDILHVLVLLPLYMCLGASVAGAARCVVRDTTWQRPQSIGGVAVGAAEGDNNRDESTLAEQHPRAHTVLFVLGLLPQAIKLFSMRGIPLSQVCGGLYLSSFLVAAGVGALARSAEYETIPQPWTTLKKRLIVPRPGLLIVMLVLMPHACFWLWYAVLPPAWSATSAAYLFSSLPGVLMVGFLLVNLLLDLSYILSSLLFFFLPDTEHFANFESAAFFFFFASSILAGGYFYYTCAILSWGVSLHLAFPLYLVLAIVLVARVAPVYLLVIFFALMNLVSSILYYRFRYDPTDTLKPLWAEKLG